MVNETAGSSINLTDFQKHSATIRSETPLTVESGTKQWGYALSFPVDSEGHEPPLIIAMRLTVREGTVGALVVADDLKTVVARLPPPAGPGQHCVEIVLESFTPGSRLALRNNTPGGRPCVFTLDGIDVRPAPPDALGAASLLRTVTDGDPPRLSLAKLRRAIAASPQSDAQPHGVFDHLDIVDVSALHERLGQSPPLDYPSSSRHKSFLDWKMENDDAPILRYLYRTFRPHRHLEFGTWAGTGACYCLEECDAAVWTINLVEGELIEGRPAYSSAIDDAPDDAVPVQHVDGRPVYQTDAGLLIGRRYREAGFGHRVCQIYCDSRTWDTSAYPRDFFDSVLIDGGHTADVVLSDTRKAFEVTRPGALIMWHDFCPDPTVVGAFASVVGVMTALTGNWEEIAASLHDVFWVQPSFLLIGVRR
ncbi:MAG TPA: class I SAM-dependent methyltransferase [Vicinamibacterales bacterium]|nr:class I SAM-dependent methyltransferase [Vicinamibacterales bacterium]